MPNGFIKLILDIPNDVPLSDLPFSFDLYFALKEADIRKAKNNLVETLNTILQVHNIKIKRENSYRSLMGIRTKYTLSKHNPGIKIPNMGLSKVWVPQIAGVLNLALSNSGFSLQSHSTMGSVFYYTFGPNGSELVDSPIDLDLPPLAVPADE